MEKQVKPERTGWRDNNLSARHRTWGVQIPMIDIDFLAVEFEYEQPLAIIEYKNEHAPEQHVYNPQYKVLIKLGDMAGLPVFSVRYATNFSWWRVVPINAIAKQNYERIVLSEYEYVEFLYKLRNKTMPPEIEIKLLESQ